MPFVISKQLILLCEGHADKAFLQALLDSDAQLANRFDIPFPIDEADWSPGDPRFGGWQAFDKMLHAIRADRVAWNALKGILIVADSGDTPQKRFKEICGVINSVGGVNVPTQPLVAAQGVANCPPIAVMMLPGDNTAGALETLLVQAVTGKRRWMLRCVDCFLSCKRMFVFRGFSALSELGREKLDKARFQCLIAALHRKDPNRSARYFFSIKPPLAKIDDPSFHQTRTRLLAFRQSMGIA